MLLRKCDHIFDYTINILDGLQDLLFHIGAKRNRIVRADYDLGQVLAAVCESVALAYVRVVSVASADGDEQRWSTPRETEASFSVEEAI